MYKNKSRLYSYAIVSLLALTNISGLLYSNNVSATNTVNETKKEIKKWNAMEDDQLRALVAKNGTGNWKDIAEQMPGRTVKQCRYRWMLYLDPNIKNTPWTEEEESLLLEKQKEFGNQWTKIVKFFPGRSRVGLQSKYIMLIMNK